MWNNPQLLGRWLATKTWKILPYTTPRYAYEVQHHQAPKEAHEALEPFWRICRKWVGRAQAIEVPPGAYRDDLVAALTRLTAQFVKRRCYDLIPELWLVMKDY